MVKSVILNETPRSTSKSFGINNIEITDFTKHNINKIKEFTNVKVDLNENEKSKIIIDNKNVFFDPKFTIGTDLVNELNNANKSIYLNIKEEVQEAINIEFTLDEEQDVLVDNVYINAKKDSKATVILKYRTSNENVKAYHNGVCQVNVEENANIKVIILNLINGNSQNYYSMNNKIAENANLDYIITDFGGIKTISNYYSKLEGDMAKNNVRTMYLGTEEQLLDLNYIAEVYGKKGDIDIEVYGALKGNSKKNFKGTIDFKKGCKKSKGNENEYCMLLSKTAKSKALPMLLCSEEDVEGTHSNSAGKIDEEKLYYIMTRGISKEDAQKLIVKAKFNSVLENIEKSELKNEILYEINKKLD